MKLLSIGLEKITVLKKNKSLTNEIKHNKFSIEASAVSLIHKSTLISISLNYLQTGTSFLCR